MYQVDPNANNGVNCPIASALVRAYESRNGRLTKSDAMVVRAAYFRVKKGKTTLEMELDKFRKGIVPTLY